MDPTARLSFLKSVSNNPRLVICAGFFAVLVLTVFALFYYYVLYKPLSTLPQVPEEGNKPPVQVKDDVALSGWMIAVVVAVPCILLLLVAIIGWVYNLRRRTANPSYIPI